MHTQPASFTRMGKLHLNVTQLSKDKHKRWIGGAIRNSEVHSKILNSHGERAIVEKVALNKMKLNL